MNKIKQACLDELALVRNQSMILWEEFDFISLRQRFSQILHDLFSIDMMSTGVLQMKGKKTRLQVVKMNVKNLLPFPADILTKISKELSLKLSKADEPIHFLCNKEVIAISLGEYEKNQHWIFLKNRENISLSILQFLTEQIRAQVHWIKKIDMSEQLIYTDDLTGLSNYRYLNVILPDEIARAQRFHQCFCVLFIDIDYFKNVNDTYGHLVGSDVLRKVGALLREMVREIDTVVRYGGDEFIIILTKAELVEGFSVAERIRERIYNLYLPNLKELKSRVTLSIGVSCYPHHGETKEELLQAADDAMYSCKKTGRNMACTYDKCKS